MDMVDTTISVSPTKIHAHLLMRAAPKLPVVASIVKLPMLIAASIPTNNIKPQNHPQACAAHTETPIKQSQCR